MTAQHSTGSGPAYDVWAAPGGTTLTAPRARLREDLTTLVAVVATSVLLGAPAGLLWAAVSPRLTVRRDDAGLQVDNIESTKAFIGADGSYLLVMLALGLLCGVLAWRFARRSGPFTVVGLLVGGTLAALVAASVGLRPGSPMALAALQDGSSYRGSFELFLGVRDGDGGNLSLRSAWAAVGWPVGAMLSFLLFAFQHPEELD